MTDTITNVISAPAGMANWRSYSDSACVTSSARKIPSGNPSAAPIRAVITLSCRTMRRTWRLVMPTARPCSAEHPQQLARDTLASPTQANRGLESPWVSWILSAVPGRAAQPPTVVSVFDGVAIA